MAKALSTDLRQRVIAAVEAGVSRHAAAARFGVSASSAIRWVAAWRAAGQVAAKPQGGDRRSRRLEVYRTTILSAVEAQVDLALAELAALVQQRHGARFAPSSVWCLLDRHGLSVKENWAGKAGWRGALRGRPSMSPGGAGWPGYRRGLGLSGSGC
jgi:transposase